MPTLEQLDTPYERRRVIEYGVDGNKVVRHWHDVQHIAGPLYKSKEEKNKYGEQEMDLYLFFEGGKDGLLYQYSMRHLEQYTPEKMMEEIERVGYDTLEHFLTTFDQSVVEGKFIGAAVIEFVRQFDTERGKKKIREDFRNFPGEAWKVEKILKSYIDGTKQDVMKEEIVIWPEEDMAISCEEYVGEMEKRSAVFESAADKEEYAPFLKLLEQEKEEYNRRREETYRAIRQYNADYMKACDEWERRIMSEFRKIKGGKTARKAVVWIIGLGIAAAVIVVIIAALATL